MFEFYTIMHHLSRLCTLVRRDSTKPAISEAQEAIFQEATPPTRVVTL